MRLGAVLAVLVSVASLLHAQRSGHATDSDSLRISQLTELEFLLNDLIAKRDFDTYAQYLADDYVRISADGRIRTKDQVLEEFRTSAVADGKAVPEVLQVRLYGNTAILTIRLTITAETVNRSSLLTKVFVQSDRRWLMVSNQGTPLGSSPR